MNDKENKGLENNPEDELKEQETDFLDEVVEEAIEAKVIDIDIEKEMKKSFLAYSMSVIMSRALPDVRDGLKPVHRRILYTLYENGLDYNRAYRKCADTVGSVLGRYHPHGDASVYDALVRLAQDFSTRYMLVDGHGNFGSVDGDPPAAYRYTEARMSKISSLMLTDIDKETVPFAPNYDDRLKEPEVLPSRFPNLLVNGSMGIAVGMATNIPPHNLGEVIDATMFLIDNEDASVEDLMGYIKGPDFPTAGMIMGLSGIKAAYNTGHGKITVRAKAEIIAEKNGRYKIIVTELPYMVNKARLCEHVAELVKDKRLEGVTNIEDHSDRNGLSVRIDVKRDYNPEVVLNQLYSSTALQSTFGVNMLSIVNKEPKVLNLKQMLKEYVSFQEEVITNRTTFDLKKARERAHILEGLKIALDNIEEVIAILRSSKTVQEGKQRLVERFDLDDVQAQAIVSMRLGQLTGLERGKIEEEILALCKKIEELLEILENRVRLLEVLKEELSEIRKKFADERRTEICQVSGDVDIEDLIPNEDCVLTLTSFGYLKRQTIDTYRIQNRGGVGVLGMTRREEDVAKEMLVMKTHDYLLFFTDKGRVHKLKCYRVPESSRTAKGTHISNLLQLFEDENVTSIIKLSEFKEDQYLVMVTKFGVIKRCDLTDFDTSRKGGLIAISLDEGDRLVWVRLTDGNKELLVATKKGKSIRFPEGNVRVTGRSSRGVKALNLQKEDYVVGLLFINQDELILTVSEKGFGRLSQPDDYRVQNRGGSGTKNYHVDKYGEVAAIDSVDTEDEIIMISQKGVIIRIKAKDIRICSRPSKGVTLMRLSADDKVVALARVKKEEQEPEEQTENEQLKNAEETGQNEQNEQID